MKIFSGLSKHGPGILDYYLAQYWNFWPSVETLPAGGLQVVASARTGGLQPELAPSGSHTHARLFFSVVCGGDGELRTADRQADTMTARRDALALRPAISATATNWRWAVSRWATRIFNLFASSLLHPANNISLTHKISTSQQQYFSLTKNQHQPAEHADWHETWVVWSRLLGTHWEANVR